MPKTRWQAFSIHLGICAAIYIVLLYFIWFHWYPHPYFAADGGWQGIRLITGVDLILGPFLTMIVFKPGKPGLRRDLILIGILQTIAVVWGTWLVYEQRTAMVTYVNATFYTLNNEQLKAAGGKAIEIANQSKTIPPYAYVRLPDDPRERHELVFKTVFSGTPLFKLGDRYEPMNSSNLKEVLTQGVDIDLYLSKFPKQNQERLEKLLGRLGGKREDYAFMPLIGRYSQPLLVLRRADGEVLDTLEIEKGDQTPPAATPTAPRSTPENTPDDKK